MSLTIPIPVTLKEQVCPNGEYYKNQPKQKQKEMDYVCNVYNTVATKFNSLKQEILNRKNQYKAYKDARQKLWTDNYKISRAKQLSACNNLLALRYDEHINAAPTTSPQADIRTRQDATSSLYQDRIYFLRWFYKKSHLLTANQKNSFKSWYEGLMVISTSFTYTQNNTTSTEILITNCEDSQYPYLATNSYPPISSSTTNHHPNNVKSKTNLSGYASKYPSSFLNATYKQIYNASKFSYVIDYPNLTEFNSYAFSVVPLPVQMQIPYTNNNTFLLKKYDEIILFRNNLVKDVYNRKLKKSNYKTYVNNTISGKSNEINTYNISLSNHIRNNYMTDQNFNDCLYQPNMPISINWSWSSKVLRQYQNYRKNIYPPKKVTGASHYPNPNIPNPSNQGYGDDFYTTYSFDE